MGRHANQEAAGSQVGAGIHARATRQNGIPHPKDAGPPFLQIRDASERRPLTLSEREIRDIEILLSHSNHLWHNNHIAVAILEGVSDPVAQTALESLRAGGSV